MIKLKYIKKKIKNDGVDKLFKENIDHLAYRGETNAIKN
jgi:hypothetical protein